MVLNNNTPKEIDIQGSLLTTIENSDLKDISKDVLEFSFDQFFNEGTFREFPIVGTIINLGKIGANIRDAIFLKKVFRFLYQLKDVSKVKRESFANKIREDEEYRQKVGENLLLVIEKLSHYYKADMLGRIYRAHLEGSIGINILEKLVSSVEKVNIHDLSDLKEIYIGKKRKGTLSDETLQALAIAGLFKMRFASGLFGGGGGEFEKCQIGDIFVKIVLM